MAGHRLQPRVPPRPRPALRSARWPPTVPGGADLDEAAALFIAQARALDSGTVAADRPHIGGNMLTRPSQDTPGPVRARRLRDRVMPAYGVPAAAYIFAPENEDDLVQVAIVAARGGRAAPRRPPPLTGVRQYYEHLLRRRGQRRRRRDRATAPDAASMAAGDHCRRRLRLGPARVHRSARGPGVAAAHAAPGSSSWPTPPSRRVSTAVPRWSPRTPSCRCRAGSPPSSSNSDRESPGRAPVLATPGES